ncbi:PREDICTED: zinc finger protein 638-like [Gekko japonicus]|uniref:Zinc finger protein 638-like n=1 Tax=Gekko japonicus TaxID=146911 RepID=A0ABM1JJC5_GEKJA|nr:PREDICTED: zinc finger protein 638-like [Gekko japonicus]
MDQEQNEEDHVSRWDNPSPVERNSQKQSPSEKAVDHNTSTESHSAKLSHLKQLLTRFGLSVDDLKKLSQYPDDQLTPENMPVLLQAIRTSKLASKAPTFPSKSTEKETVSRADGSGPTVQKKVIDYGHKSKYGYNEGPVEVKASSTATDESVKGFQTQEPASVPAAASSLISNPKNLTTELIQPAGSPASTPNCQASPLVNPAQKVPLAELGIPATVPPVRPPPVAPVPQAVRHPATPPLLSPAVNQPSFVPELMELLRRHERSEHTRRADPPNRLCQTMAGQRSLWKEAEEPFKSPFGVVKASWLPDFSPTEKQKGKKLPTSPQMCDYYAVTPRIFPHTCSLCNEDCIDKKDWLQHQNTFLHNENCRRLLQQ